MKTCSSKKIYAKLLKWKQQDGILYLSIYMTMLI